MREARILVDGCFAGILTEVDNAQYLFDYDEKYQGAPVSLLMPINQRHYEYPIFPPFFEGLLPEGMMLEALLRKHKINKHDYFSQLMLVGHDLVGQVQVMEAGA